MKQKMKELDKWYLKRRLEDIAVHLSQIGIDMKRLKKSQIRAGKKKRTDEIKCEIEELRDEEEFYTGLEEGIIELLQLGVEKISIRDDGEEWLE